MCGVSSWPRTGGASADTFDFNAFNESGIGTGNNDDILDFEGAGVEGGDIIDLATLDAVAGGADQAFTFIGTALSFTGAGQLRAIQVGADTVIQGNTNGNVNTIELEIRLVGITASTLTATDFNL